MCIVGPTNQVKCLAREKKTCTQAFIYFLLELMGRKICGLPQLFEGK